MTKYAIQCMVTRYEMKIVTVDASSVEDACVKGLAKAQIPDDWESLETFGNVFVDGIVKDPSGVPLNDFCESSLDVPVGYSENGVGRDWS
jgi:hypothetical protein